MTTATVGIVIIIIFIILFSTASAIISYHNVSKHWSSYRCNPLVMPLAGLFGHDSQDNMTQCTVNTQNKVSPYKQQPLNYHIATVHETVKSHADAVQKTRGLMSGFRGGVMDGVTDIFSTITTATAETKILMARFKDIMGRAGGTFVSLAYWLEGSITTAQSLIGSKFIDNISKVSAAFAYGID